jgi:uncharacterized protein YjiS (DUF1127 family)
MQAGNLTARDVALLTSPRTTVQGGHHAKGGHVRRIAAALIKRMLTVAPHRTVADLGDHQLRDIGLWRVDRPVPLECAQRAFEVHEAWGRLRVF